MGNSSSNNNNSIMSNNTTVDGYIRRAHHAGSWYSDDANELDAILSKYLQDVEDEDPQQQQQPLRGIICPHAGYSYSGPTAAYSYKHLQNQILLDSASSPSSSSTTTATSIRHILVLHPSHHVYLDGCAVSGASVIETPVGNLTVDDELRQEVLQLGGKSLLFSVMSQSVDEREHSGEMQYPYIAKAVLQQQQQQQQKNSANATTTTTTIKVLPIMCGSISSAQEATYGKLLAPIVARPDVVCVVSTDFCHWGSRFQYQPTPNNTTTTTSSTTQHIFEHIRELDHRGMSHIELQRPGAFADYLKETRNTICGRHAIGVWLNAVQANNQSNAEVLDIQFVKYAQSSEVRSMRESSVSYASATARTKKK